MYDYLDDRQTKRLKELVPYKILAPDADEIIEELDRLNNIINDIWQVFENGVFEDGCDCIKIYDYLKALKENK